jgi:cell division protein ZapA (FtsZ GTPase activity inhibitor)
MSERLRELLAKATPGHWSTVAAVPGAKGLWYISGNHAANNAEVDIGEVQGGAQSAPYNAALIVAAVNALPALIECAEALKEIAKHFDNQDISHKDFRLQAALRADAALAALEDK